MPLYFREPMSDCVPNHAARPMATRANRMPASFHNAVRGVFVWWEVRRSATVMADSNAAKLSSKQSGLPSRRRKLKRPPAIFLEPHREQHHEARFPLVGGVVIAGTFERHDLGIDAHTAVDEIFQPDARTHAQVGVTVSF